jgi:dual specificity MAP kinase phosphatase
MYEVIPNLYLASWEDARRNCPPRAFVVNCTKNFPMLSDYGIRIPVDDDMSGDAIFGMFHALPSVIDSIDYALASNGKVVVHCRAGQQRSAAVVAAYLMYKYKWDIPEAIEFIRSKKPDAFITGVNFAGSLNMYKNRL